LIVRHRPAPEHGDFCIAEVPDDAPAFLIEVLGAEDRPEWDDPSVISAHRLRVRFSDEVEREAAAHHEPGAAERRGREDLREQLVFTIDPEDARDHDDALSVTALSHQHWEVGIHIADVSHYVVDGSAIDREAGLRGTSVYLPGGVVPMLPERLSADLCSLRPDRDRLALSLFAELDGDGKLRKFRFAETVIRSRHKLHYAEVQEVLDGKRRVERTLHQALESVQKLARALRRRRRAAGALELEVPEIKAWVDGNGVPIRLERRAHLESHELIEEFMLLANRCVGHEGGERRSGVLYRIHEPPTPSKLQDLDRALQVLKLPRLGRLDDPARALQSLLAAPIDPQHRRLLHRMVLRALPRARYDARDHGHFGLASREYCHFTSPIRRYPDLHNHRRVREWIRGERDAAWDPSALAEDAASCSASEETAVAAEREAVKVKSLRLLEGRLGDRASGMITGLVPRGCFVELDEPPVEGFVRVGQELDDRFDLDAAGVRLIGRHSRKRFTLGDTVQVIVARVDVPARECDFALDQDDSRRRRRRTRRG
jgi:ribonuclease R